MRQRARISRSGGDRPLKPLDGRWENTEHDVPSTLQKTADIPRTHGTGLTPVVHRMFVDLHFSASVLDEKYLMRENPRYRGFSSERFTLTTA
jgi:hypothetical protein